MSTFSLLVSIVPHDRGEKLTSAAVQAGCGGGTVMMARALAKTNLAAVLGLGETTKDIIYMVVETRQKQNIIDAIVNATLLEKADFGQLFSLDVSQMLKTGTITPLNDKGEDAMQKECTRDMISVIVNKGYADDVMAAARRAGAGGGTVINARGTAREDDEKFFGVHIVPEKEMLIMVVEHDKKAAVLDAIRDLKCLREPGSGIAFASGVEDFTLLGKKNA
ncbi:MAG: transcriptional regulator [Treponema sp.]|nr:transcriptional regulator [Treponema sp.]